MATTTTTDPLIQGEAKTIQLTVTNSSGVAVDCSTTTCSFKLVKNLGGTILISKVEADFDKTDAASGILYFDVSATETSITCATYIGQLTIQFTTSNIDKSQFNIPITEEA